MNILKDIMAAVKLTGEVRRARETGAAVEIRTIPLITYVPAFQNTLEGCLLGRDADLAVRQVFSSLPYEDQRRLEFSPVNAGWVDRARFWQEYLRPALPPRMYHWVMMQFIRRYAYCQRLATGRT